MYVYRQTTVSVKSLSVNIYIYTEIIFNLPLRIIIYKHRYLLRIEITYLQ